jgi:hypothetical protein
MVKGVVESRLVSKQRRRCGEEERLLKWCAVVRMREKKKTRQIVYGCMPTNAPWEI